MSKRLIRKDQFLRKRHKSFEIWNTLNKSLKKSLVLYGIPRNIVIKEKKTYSKTPIRNYCFKTGRSSGVVPYFRISRMLFRKKSRYWSINGYF